MPTHALGDVEPDIHPDAYVHPDAVVIGDVTTGPEASAVERGRRFRTELRLLGR